MQFLVSNESNVLYNSEHCRKDFRIIYHILIIIINCYMLYIIILISYDPPLFNLVIYVLEWIQFTMMTFGHIFIHRYFEFKCTSLKCLNWMDHSAGIVQSSGNFASWWITLWIVNWFLLIRIFVCNAFTAFQIGERAETNVRL